MHKVEIFKAAHKRFTEGIKYITEHEDELKADLKRWEKIKSNFYTKFEQPLDAAWEALPEEDKKKLAPIYLFRKAQQDEIVKKVIEVFDAKIIKVTKE